MPIPDVSLESLEQSMEGDEKQKFLAFMRKMLQWNPADRQDADDVYWDEWLLADQIAAGEIEFEDDE